MQHLGIGNTGAAMCRIAIERRFLMRILAITQGLLMLPMKIEKHSALLDRFMKNRLMKFGLAKSIKIYKKIT